MIYATNKWWFLVALECDNCGHIKEVPLWFGCIKNNKLCEECGR